MKHKVHPRKHAENSHLPHPQKFANGLKARWHKARRAGRLGEQVDRAFYRQYQRDNKARDISALKQSLQ